MPLDHSLVGTFILVIGECVIVSVVDNVIHTDNMQS